MSPQGWLPITEYAGKYRVSISTLRRRIKTGEIEYSFQEGKYLLKDSPLTNTTQAPATVAPPHKVNGGGAVNPPSVQVPVDSEENSPILATANRLLNELKKAYSLILQEKEEQVLTLKEEVADLRTLVKVLESENERLRRQSMLSEPWVE
ncbi:MAG: hypothetical protein AB7N80_16085 [Bdellovibrionales bacterium]